MSWAVELLRKRRRIARTVIPDPMKRFAAIPGRGSRRSVFFALIALMATAVSLGCRRSETGDRLAVVRPYSPPPLVRVLLGKGLSRARFRAPKEVSIHDGESSMEVTINDWGELHLESGGGFLFGDRSIDAFRFTLSPAANTAISLSRMRKGEWSLAMSVPGELIVEVDEKGGFSVVNELDVESYVACVVAVEAWPDFHEEAFRGQAIIARTYVLDQLKRKPDAAYHVVSTEASQVYRGIRRNRAGTVAAKATDYTRGIVLTFFEGKSRRIFPTYYHSACGGLTQSSAIYGPGDDLPPLRGGVSCDYCKIAPNGAYRWETVRFSRGEVFEKLCRRYSQLRSMGGMAGLEPIERSAGGRIVRVRLDGTNGESYEMLAEHLRLALGSRKVRSTYCEISIEGDEVVFSEGKGFGHGLGLCQWGMEGQAREGKSASEILSYYYPGTSFSRAY